MPDSREISTGSSRLDADLKMLFELRDTGKLSHIMHTIRPADDTPEQFAQLVPDGLLRIAATLTTPFLVQNLRENLPQAQQLIEEAKRVVETEATELIAHPLAVKRIQQIFSPESQEMEPLVSAMRVITSVSRIPTWLGTPPRLLPAVRMAFLNKRGELLLDTSLDWDGLFFVIEALMRTATECMIAGRPLLEREQLNLESLSHLAERIHNIDASLAEIRAVAPSYRINLASPPAAPQPATDAGAAPA